MGFTASLSNTAKVMTATMLVVIVVSMVPIFIEAHAHFKIIISITIAATFVVSWGYSTRGYIVAHRQLIIKRPFGNKSFDLKDVRSVEKIASKNLRYSLRTFSNSGLFGYYGMCYTKKFGGMRWYAANIQNAVTTSPLRETRL